MAKLPPQPLGVAPGSSYWNDWYEKLRTFVEQITTSVDWSIITGKPTTLAGYGITDSPIGASPTASVGLTVVNGVATTFMRSDAAPPISQNISPTWTANHRFNASVGIGVAPGAPFDCLTGTNYRLRVSETAAALFFDSLNAAASAWSPHRHRAITISWFTAAAGTPTTGMILDATNNLAINGGVTTGNTTLHTTSVALTNGAAAAAGTLLNAPTAGNPTKWISINDNGTTRWIPTWT